MARTGAFARSLIRILAPSPSTDKYFPVESFHLARPSGGPRSRRGLTSPVGLATALAVSLLSPLPAAARPGTPGGAAKPASRQSRLPGSSGAQAAQGPKAPKTVMGPKAQAAATKRAPVARVRQPPRQRHALSRSPRHELPQPKGALGTRAVPAPASAATPPVKAPGALVLDDSGRVVYSRDPDHERPIASISKLAATLVVVERGLNLDGFSTITRGDAQVARGGARSRLLEGMTLSNRDLLHAALLGSDNRAIPALGRAVKLSPGELAAAMTAKARQLGLTHTRFQDPTGLSRGNVSTPRETISLLKAVMAHPVLGPVTRRVEYDARPLRRPPIRYVNTYRPAMREHIQVLGGKTGFNNGARYCLVIAVKIEGRTYYMSLLSNEGKLTRFADVVRVSDWIASGRSKPTQMRTRTAALTPTVDPTAEPVVTPPAGAPAVAPAVERPVASAVERSVVTPANPSLAALAPPPFDAALSQAPADPVSPLYVASEAPVAKEPPGPKAELADLDALSLPAGPMSLPAPVASFSAAITPLLAASASR